jgi:uncharacterized membrane protein YfcA
VTQLILALVFGALIGLSLGLVGGGGSILTVPILVYAIGQPVQLATTTSLAIVGANALVGVVGHARAGNVLPKTGLAFGLSGFLGAFAGTCLNRRVPGPLLLALFAVVMVAAAAALLRKRDGRGEQAEAQERYDVRGWLTLGLSGLVTGFMTGFFGVGGGFVIVPALVLVLGLPMRAAVGTSLLIIAINSASGLIARFGSLGLDWTVTALFILGGAAGVALGVRLAGRLPQRRLTQAFAGLIVLVACYVLYQSARSAL